MYRHSIYLGRNTVPLNPEPCKVGCLESCIAMPRKSICGVRVSVMSPGTVAAPRLQSCELVKRSSRCRFGIVPRQTPLLGSEVHRAMRVGLLEEVLYNSTTILLFSRSQSPTLGPKPRKPSTLNPVIKP